MPEMVYVIAAVAALSALLFFVAFNDFHYYD
jgi:hypothetical protein